MKKTKVVSFSMPPEMRKKLTDIAKRCNVSSSTLVRLAVSELLKTPPTKNLFKRSF